MNALIVAVMASCPLINFTAILNFIIFILYLKHNEQQLHH